MPATTQHGYLLLADISGYTGFIAGTELEHSQEIISELLELILSRLTPTLMLSKLEGDAVFVYAPESRLPHGEALLDMIESTYVAFKDRIEGMHRRTTCTCKACQAIPTLDLKFIAHHGDYVVQDIAGIKELAGSDVNLVHRLLKNRVAEVTGWRAYLLITEKTAEHLGVQPEGAQTSVESYEHLGEVQTHSWDLNERYRQIVEARRIFIAADDADFVLIQDFPGGPPIVWDWLTDPRNRNIWAAGAGHFSAAFRPGGRTGVGARTHCAHGKTVAVETILDWRPFDYFSLETQDGGMVMPETMQLEPLPNGQGTRLHDHIQLQMQLPRWLRRLILKFMFTAVVKYDTLMGNSARLLGDEMARKQAAESQA